MFLATGMSINTLDCKNVYAKQNHRLGISKTDFPRKSVTYASHQMFCSNI